MTYVSNDPLQFAEDALAGFVAANPQYVQRVHGGVVRTASSPAGEVAVVLGGGSGHYPAFAGWVGPGMAHGAVCGNVFSSPSASQVRSVARAAHNGGGVVLGFGNYAGDVLHFGQAAEQLRAEGIDVRIVAVTDDIASAPPNEAARRRGIAGDLVVFKVMGAAAAEGCSLDEVEALARHANDRTRTLGVAFSGCTLPGADTPLFTIPAGSVGVGLGIHGEPGIDTIPRGSADEIADILVDGVLAEEPELGAAGYEGRVAVLLNGLGSTKYEELFVLYARVAARLRDHGVVVVQPEVGEHVTSLDMSGVSLTLTYLDADLERLWAAPVESPALRRVPSSATVPRRVIEAVSDTGAAGPGAPESHVLARAFTDRLGHAAERLAAEQERLGRMDAVAGDGDHGQGMVLGSSAALRAATAALAARAGIKTALIEAGAAWSEGAGGTSGALWGAALTAAGNALADDSGAGEAEIVAAVSRGARTIQRLGGAEPGDKTMVCAALPFTAALEKEFAAGMGLKTSWIRAAAVARDAAEATADIVARRGRASTHGEHSLGTPDPGAMSFALVVSSAFEDHVDEEGSAR